MKLFLRNVCLLIISTLLTIAAVWIVGELILRGIINYKMVDTIDMYVKSNNEALNKELRPGYNGVYFGRGISINSGGFRDLEYGIDKKKGTYRIVSLGDSMSFGQGLSLEDIYPKVLENLLNSMIRHKNSRIKKSEVLNFSVPGYNTIQEYELLKTKAIYYNPDLIILNFCLNDVRPVKTELFYKPSPHLPRFLQGNFINSLKVKSVFAQYVLSHAAVLGRRMGIEAGYISQFRGAYEDNSEHWIRCREALLDIKKCAENKSAAFLVVIIPLLSDLNEHHPLKKEIGAVKKFCDANKIPAIDLFPYFKGHKAESLWINPVDGHPNKKAHEIIANIVKKYLLENDWLL